MKILLNTLIMFAFLAYSLALQAQIRETSPKDLLLNQEDNVLEGKVFFEAKEKIIASQKIGEKAQVIQKAGKMIVLREGFQAKEGSSFVAMIIENQVEDNSASEKENKAAFSEDESLAELIEIFPNPTRGKLSIKFPTQYLKEENSAAIELYSVNGKQVLSVLVKNGSFYEIDLSKEAKGAFLLKIMIPNNSPITKRIVLE